MKKIIGAATATVFGLGAFTTSAIAETIVTADVLNVREKPTTESKVIEKVKEGQKLKVINTEEGWSKIDLNGKELFVSSEFTKDIYHVTANLLNVRSEANTESEILGRLKKDDVIESTHQAKDGWLQFEYKGKTAYANVSFLSSTAPSEKKAGEKTKQVAKVQKAVKAKEEAKTQKVAKIQEIAKTKETTKMLEEVKVQEVAKGKEEKKVQEIAKPKEETKVQEIAKPKEEAKVKEVEKVKEEAKAQEIAKAKEEAKVQEIAKAKEEAKVKEVEKVKEEAKAQEIAKAKEEAKAQEIAKAKEEAKAQEIAKAKEEAKAQEIARAKEEAKAQEIAKAKEEAKAQEIARAKEEAKAQEIARAKEEAKAREIEKAKEEAKAKEESKNNTQSAKRELTVVATAYTADPSENGTYGGRVLTAMGHDLTANPNMRIIAVDPKVIPLGSKVWVEGYGEAIAGDTGSAIKGNRIDVLMGSKSKAMNWGRQTVKVKIL
ncbi:cell wall-binding protein EntB [Bacillus toyonensis]|uniref:cell wall-binding protein EntB n=2 Tax=Bacillus toyonensis TaxID=155322 RepID=UPI001C00B388|nr:cell wall-binding protein EntB [Bacillus toyonensis]MCU5395460.1 cell wall-binding protein EntB [Bacillus toyonensis]QWH45584.1 enterotoxin [Bacillus toyonensis]HDR3499053.1 SH3 domain-containing protein [Bacillus toyonensis]HDR7224841.1 SH3 domain-containing protein [Bacillus toyonensis]HDR7349657.1 SH3 domain-containing protein [Bacillus toyonensis]